MIHLSGIRGVGPNSASLMFGLMLILLLFWDHLGFHANLGLRFIVVVLLVLMLLPGRAVCVSCVSSPPFWVRFIGWLAAEDLGHCGVSYLEVFHSL